MPFPKEKLDEKYLHAPEEANPGVKKRDLLVRVVRCAVQENPQTKAPGMIRILLVLGIPAAIPASLSGRVPGSMFGLMFGLAPFEASTVVCNGPCKWWEN